MNYICQAIVIFVISAISIIVINPVMHYDFYALFLIFVFAGALIFFIDMFRDSEEPPAIAIAVILFSLIYLFPINFFRTSAILHHDDYRNLIGTVTESSFDSDVEIVDIDNIRVVDRALAARAAEELLGNDPGLGSQVQIGKMHIQTINGQLRWVAPLEPLGLFRWYGMDGTPGYITVSASDYTDVKMTTGMNMRYTNGSFFHTNLHRHIWLSGYLTTGISDPVLEIDETGKPWWTIALYDRQIGMDGDKVSGLILVDPETGGITEHVLSEIPSWIDRVYPEDIAVSQMDNWGLFVKGWVNQSEFGPGENVITVTQNSGGKPEMTLVHGGNGRSYWYTGMTSRGRDQGTVGFVLIDTRTGVASIYYEPGPTELAAAEVLSGEISNFADYTVTSPFVVNLQGHRTYAATIKDGSGNIKKFGFVSGETRAIFAVGDNVNDAAQKFQSALRKSGQSFNLASGFEEKEAIGKLYRLSRSFEDNTTWSWFMVEGVSGKLFRSPAHQYPELRVTKDGDIVAVKYIDTVNIITDLSDFDNMDIDLQ